MKKAVIVVGKHYSGKSLTINEHLKPLLGIGQRARNFTLAGKSGLVLSQSFEEALRDFIATCKKYFAFELLVFACRPENEPGSKLHLIRGALQKASFNVIIVEIEDKSEAAQKAKEIFDILNSN